MMTTRKTRTRCEFRIESNRPLRSSLYPASMTQKLEVHDRTLAVVMATKTYTIPCGGEIRVVHAPTGEVIFRKRDDCPCGEFQG